ncbi:hypothetical protein C900_02542 [Fulvivirga imtechensis AK7]|uniref:Uncharacterized protein n=1 Tax=Fulvivirga imtechensis AK7 TaxID=1237149 RepID=L8JV64_9BACT|nr:glycosyltransferase [Fulvivirga imtechensis]ELR71479.1 hypothetical protein C900_02542 [Fulvivirga imtechensis AK7]
MEDQQIGAINNNLYLTRYAYGEQLITDLPHPQLDLIVTIPCYNEPQLIRSLQSLRQCITDAVYTEVIVVINESIEASPTVSAQNKRTFEEATAWAALHSTEYLRFYILYKNDLPGKHAGVGLARKIAMDEAVRRFEYWKKPEGVIVCFDADSICEVDYLQAIYNFFRKNPHAPGCSIYFEHPLEGDYEKDIYEAIIDYELFLRYYVNALRYAGFPYAYETIGSSMAVRSAAYQKQGGMNRRKAGEDFYFLHKIIPLGNFGEINNTRVIPSPRRSDRVPFGTGKAVNDWLVSRQLHTYAPEIFEDLKQFLDTVANLYQVTPKAFFDLMQSLPESLRGFLQSNDIENHVERINRHSASPETFSRHFFQWFDGFKVLKYIHFARDQYYANVPVAIAATQLFEKLGLTVPTSSRDLLLAYRERDRNPAHP